MILGLGIGIGTGNDAATGKASSEIDGHCEEGGGDGPEGDGQQEQAAGLREELQRSVAQPADQAGEERACVEACLARVRRREPEREDGERQLERGDAEVDELDHDQVGAAEAVEDVAADRRGTGDGEDPSQQAHGQAAGEPFCIEASLEL